MTLLLILACRSDLTSGCDAEPGADTSPIPPEIALPGEARDILMISMDTFRRDLLLRYGGEAGDEADTPFLDQLADTSLTADRHRSCSAWTYPSVVCALTGRMPYDLGAFPWIGTPAEDMPRIPEGTPTLASLLAAAGWQTRLISANKHLGPTHATDTGYEAATDIDLSPAAEVVDAGLSWLRTERDPERRWLLHLHFLDPHANYEPPEAYRAEMQGRPALPWDLSTEQGNQAFINAMEAHEVDEATRAEAEIQTRILYEGEARYLDDELRRLYETVAAEGLLRETLVVVWTDHGEQFWEHGDHGHNKSLHYGENDGLLMVSGPGVTPARWPLPTSHLDLLPTLLAALVLPAPAGLRGAPLGAAPPDRPLPGALWLGGEPPSQSVIVGEHRLLYHWSGDLEFYDLAADPAEQAPLPALPDAPAWTTAVESLRAEAALLQPAIEGFAPVALP